MSGLELRKSLIANRLAAAGLRMTRARLQLGKLLFAGADRHVSAEQLFTEAQEFRYPPSLATVYNTLNQFTRAGLLREIPVEGQRSFFDTRTGPHHHFLDEATGRLFDAPDDIVALALNAPPPEGFVVSEVQVVVRLKPAKAVPAG